MDHYRTIASIEGGTMLWFPVSLAVVCVGEISLTSKHAWRNEYPSGVPNAYTKGLKTYDYKHYQQYFQSALGPWVP